MQSQYIMFLSLGQTYFSRLSKNFVFPTICVLTNAEHESSESLKTEAIACLVSILKENLL